MKHIGLDTGNKAETQKGAYWKPALLLAGLYSIMYALFGGHWIFGDAYNYQEMSKGCANIAPFMDNSYISACIYTISRHAPLAINTAILVLAVGYLTYQEKRIRERNMDAFTRHRHINDSILLCWYILACPQVLFRYWEPSKEFGIIVLLVLCGILVQKKTREGVLASMITLMIVITYRPYAILGYIAAYAIWQTTDRIVNSRKPASSRNRQIAYYVAGILLLAITIRGVTYLAYPELFKNWINVGKHGIFGEWISSPWSIIPISFLNIVGGVSVFTTTKYWDVATTAYFMDWIWRLTLVALLIIQRRGRLLMYITAIAVLLASAVPFSHPRYLLPFIAIGAGMEFGSITRYSAARAEMLQQKH